MPFLSTEVPATRKSKGNNTGEVTTVINDTQLIVMAKSIKPELNTAEAVKASEY